LYDCSILAAGPKSTCPGAEGKVCLVYFKNRDMYDMIDWRVSNKAEESGCIGVIAFFEDYHQRLTSNDHTPLLIPYVYIDNEEGMKLLRSKIGSNATIEVDVFGAKCWPGWGLEVCRENWPCGNGDFCSYFSQSIGEDIYSDGMCGPCPMDANGDPNPLACYFDEDVSYDSVQNVQSCASSCGAEVALTSKSCKFCPSDLTKFQFGIESEEERCIFCPQNDMQFPDRTIALFGDNITCYQMERFFQRLPVPNDSTNCQLAQSMNYICGCGGIGYAGAKTHTKQVVLAWLPRVAAILSLMVSYFHY
jgi:hypothetical protein